MQDGSVPRRPAPYSRRQVRAEFRAFAWRNRWLLIGLSVGLLAFGSLESLFASGYLLGFIHGFLLAAFIGMVSAGFVLVSGLTFKVAGAWGEDNTRDVLRASRRRRTIYGWIDCLELKDGDVDHLVFTRAGVLAIDSKWHSHGLTQALIEQDTSKALRAARRASSILRSLKAPQQVIPVVVMWGGEQKQLTGNPQYREGVHFVAGTDFRRWLKTRCQGQALLDRTTSRQLLTQLHEFRERVRP